MDPKKGWEYAGDADVSTWHSWKDESRATPSSGDFKYTERVENDNSSIWPDVTDHKAPEK